VLNVIAAPQSRAIRVLLLNCCFMVNLLPSNYLANFPVSWVEQNFTLWELRRQLGIMPVWQGTLHRRAKVPVRKIPPVMAGIRASKHQNLAFPCNWRAQWLVQTPDILTLKWGCIYLPLRGQHTFSVSRLTLLQSNESPLPVLYSW
jgi:hypothetical protein